MLSFGSRRSRSSADGVPKMDLTETSKEKSHLRSKADPTKAMNEAQPGECCASMMQPHFRTASEKQQLTYVQLPRL